MPAIEMLGVGVEYRDRRGNSIVALDDVDIVVAQSEFVSIVGPSGCGKSTILKVIAGLVGPSSGTVHVNEAEVRHPSRDVGMMFQHPVLLPWRTVLTNVLLPVQMLHLDLAKYRERAVRLLQEVGLRDFLNRYPNELSGGMQQRVAICRALVHEPPVLLLDEPFSALDSLTREQLNDLVADVCRRTNQTAVLVTHDIEEAVYLSDKVVIVSDRPGKVTKVVDVAIPHPRRYAVRHLPKFHDLTVAIRATLGITDGSADGARLSNMPGLKSDPGDDVDLEE